MKLKCLWTLLAYLICLSLSACSPSAEEQAATETQAASYAFATQTALAPTATRTPTPTATSTATPTITPTPTVTLIPAPSATPYGMSKYGNPFVVFTARDERGWWTVFGTNLDETPLQYYSVSSGDRTAHMPVWSPDASYLAWVEQDALAMAYYYVVFDLFNSQIFQPSQQPVDSNAKFCWTYDSKYLVWSDHQPNSREMDIYRLEVETGEITDLTQDSPVWDAFPACSPVSDAIAFVSDRADGGKGTDNIWVMDSQGDSLRQLTNTPGWENGRPTWSPDGREIAYYHSGYPGTSDVAFAQGGVYVVKSDGCESRLVVKDDTLLFGANEAPVWSPDGRYLAYSAGLDESTISVVSTLDGTLLWSSELPGRKSDLSWSSNSAYLLFTNEVDMINQIYILAIAEPRPVPMVTLPDNLWGMFAP